MPSQQAQVATLIRRELKANGIAGRAKSRSASMMTAVDVYLIDPLPATIKRVEQFCAQYEYGSFDGMTDMYNYDNVNNDIPQVKYLHVHAEYSDVLQQAAWAMVRAHRDEFAAAPERYTDIDWQLIDDCGDYALSLVRSVLSGSNDEFAGFWRKYKRRITHKASTRPTLRLVAS